MMIFRPQFMLLAVVAIFTSPLASAMVIEDGTYVLGNHPDGQISPPPYGLRLDGLVDPAANYSFDFEHDGAEMKMVVDKAAATIRIVGKAFGGEDAGAAFTDPSLWHIDFLYTGVTQLLDSGIRDLMSMAGTGTIDQLHSNGDVVATYNLAAKYSDVAGFGFRLGDHGGHGHRGAEGISGWGWLNHALAPEDPSTVDHIPTSNWLFTATLVPEPMACLVWGSVFGSVFLLRKRVTAALS